MRTRFEVKRIRVFVSRPMNKSGFGQVFGIYDKDNKRWLKLDQEPLIFKHREDAENECKHTEAHCNNVENIGLDKKKGSGLAIFQQNEKEKRKTILKTMLELFIKNGQVGYLDLDGQLILKHQMRLSSQVLIEIRNDLNNDD